MRNAKFYDEQISAKVAEARKVTNFAEAEGRDVNPEESAIVENIIAEVDKLKALKSQAEKLETVESSLKESAGRISKFSGIEPIHKDVQRYSIVRAIKNFVEFNGRLTGLEAEVSQEIAKRTGKAPHSFYMPLEFGNLDLSTGAGALDSITDHSNFIELLRKKMLCDKLGVRILSDLNGVVSIPRQSGGASAYWIAADGTNTITASNPTIVQVPLSPNTVGAQTKYTRQFVSQTSMNVEAFVRNDLAACLAHELDRVVLAGSGSGAEPEGVLNNSSVTTVALGVDGAYPTFAKIVEMETAVASGNADVDTMHFVTTPGGRGKLKSTEIASNTGRMIWENDTVNGYSAHASNQLPSTLTKGSYGTGLSAAVFGNFDDAMIGLWGGVDVLVNPYSNDDSGAIRVTVMQDADVALRNAASFAKVLDLKTV